jgi:TPR repeat protein
VPQDNTQALFWRRKAAEQGDLQAQYALGFIYAAGDGAARDNEEAFKWFHRAANRGHADAQAGVGLSYWQGKGVTMNLVEACRWLTLAAGKGHEGAQRALSEIKPKLLASEITEAERWAKTFKAPGDH